MFRDYLKSFFKRQSSLHLLSQGGFHLAGGLVLSPRVLCPYPLGDLFFPKFSQIESVLTGEKSFPLLPEGGEGL